MNPVLLVATVTWAASHPLPPGAEGWAQTRAGAIRGITVGPIENALHPDVGYGTAAGRAALEEAKAMGATWVALTPFGRVWDLSGGGVDLTFEAPVMQNTADVELAIRDAHALGLRVMLVPHLWVETGGWRALVDPGDDEGWTRWGESYRHFVLHWADVAERTGVELLSVGVELRSWVTRRHASSFIGVIEAVRQRYRGLLTYSANWDDVETTTILGHLDLIGVNAFYPLTKKEGANLHDLLLGGERVAADLEVIARRWGKPVVLTEVGYTSRVDPAIEPWLWPDDMEAVTLDQRAPARAMQGLLAPLADEPWCAGFFVWRTYADPADVSQEAEWGFSPRGKLAELVLRDAFATTWASDGRGSWASWAGLVSGDGHRARRVGVYGWSPSPPRESLFWQP